MLPYISEFVGTFLLILLGCGVVANVNLEKSGMKGAGNVLITMGWGFAVMLPAFIFGNASGAHFNPALTLALAVDGSFSWSRVPGYVTAQFSGAFLGAVLVYVMYKEQFNATEDKGVKLGVFCTSPSVPNKARNFICEAVATFVLVFSIKGISQAGNVPAGVNNFLVMAIIVSIGMSLGGLTGYAINPARDLAPRLAHTILPIKDKGSSNWHYAMVPLVGPIVGALIGVFTYHIIPW